MALTDTAIRKAKATSKRQLIADGSGLYLKVDVSGAKTWMLRSRRGGTAVWNTLGTYPAMALIDARKTALNRADNELPGMETVQECYDDWYKLVILKTYKSPAQLKDRLTLHFLPKMGPRLLTSIKRAEVSKLLADLAERSPVAANRVLANVKMLFEYAIGRGWLEDSPATAIKTKVVGGPEKTRKRTLSDEELTTFIHHIRSDRFDPKTRLALALILLTGQRSGEVRGVTRKEFVGKLWKIPAARMKEEEGGPQTVDAGVLFRTVLRTTFRLHGDVPFSDAKTEDGLMPRQVLSRAMGRMGFKPNATPHDLRRTMSTRMADLGVMPHVTEKCLAHKMTGMMEIYNRAEYAPEKAAAFRLWNRHLLRLRKKEPQEIAQPKPELA